MVASRGVAAVARVRIGRLLGKPGLIDGGVVAAQTVAHTYTTEPLIFSSTVRGV
jgi:hypothetical protein